MNADRHYERLDSLWAEIARLEQEIVERERESLSMAGTEHDCLAAAGGLLLARAALDRARREHGILAQFLVVSLRPTSRAA